MLTALIFSIQTQSVTLAAGRITFENHLIKATLLQTPCWFVTCKNSRVSILPPIRGKSFNFDYNTKQRTLLGEQEYFNAPVYEELTRAGTTYRFVYCESSASKELQLQGQIMAPLVRDANYLVWSCAFDGVSSDSSTFMHTAIQEFLFKIPQSMRNNSLRLARGRIRTASQTEPKNDMEMLSGVLKTILVGGFDARDAVNFLATVPRTLEQDSQSYLQNDLPISAMNFRKLSTDREVRTAYSFLAQYFGGRAYRKDWLDDLSSLSYTDPVKVANSALSSFAPDTFRWRYTDIGATFNSKSNQYKPYVEPNSQALTRFQKSKDENVRMILTHYLTNPGSEEEAKKWIPVLVHSTEDSWAKPLAIKLAEWLKSPALSPDSGITMTGLRQKYKDIYGID